MKKSLLVLLFVSLLFGVFALSAFAESAAEDTALNSTVFESFYNAVINNLDKILSALAFIGTVVIALTYKSGLLPLIRGALSKLSSSITALKEENELSKEISHEGVQSAEKALGEAKSAILTLNERLAHLEESLIRNEEERGELYAFKTVMEAQIDMLYEVFMSSSLPAYLKESIGDKIIEMRRSVKKESTEDK